MTSEDKKALVRRLVDEAQSKGNLRVVDEILADDFVDHSPFDGVPPTRDGVRVLFAALRTAFPDLHVTIHDQIAEGDKVVTRKRFQGTHRAPFMGIEPTGRAIDFEVIDILTVRDGKVAEHRLAMDRLTLLQQLGAMG